MLNKICGLDIQIFHFKLHFMLKFCQDVRTGLEKHAHFCYLCPKNLTFPEAEREQRCPRLVVVIFCLFFSICQSDLSFAGVNQSNS